MTLWETHDIIAALQTSPKKLLANIDMIIYPFHLEATLFQNGSSSSAPMSRAASTILRWYMALQWGQHSTAHSSQIWGQETERSQSVVLHFF